MSLNLATILRTYEALNQSESVTNPYRMLDTNKQSLGRVN